MRGGETIFLVDSKRREASTIPVPASSSFDDHLDPTTTMLCMMLLSTPPHLLARLLLLVPPSPLDLLLLFPGFTTLHSTSLFIAILSVRGFTSHLHGGVT